MEFGRVVRRRRMVRTFHDRPIAPEAVDRILEAGRISGSSKNHQPWRFVVVRSRALLDRLAEVVFTRGNLLAAPLFVAVLADDHTRAHFDCGRAVQNMLLAAWNDGVGGCPNGFADAGAACELLGVRTGQQLVVGLSFGYPARPRRPARRPPEEWVARAKRTPLDELVQAWL